ncbi:unnamed protein product, partial [Laminaria digitata]
QGVELGGRRVRVGWAQKNTSLCVAGLDPSVTTDMLVREFGRFGPLDKDLTTIKPGAKCGFVKYRYRLHAETAKKDLNERPAFGGLCSSLRIEWNSVESGARAEGSETAGSVDGSPSEGTAGGEGGGGGGGGGDGGGGGGPGTPGPQHAGGGGHGFRHARGEGPNSTIHVQFEGDLAHVSGVNEEMIRKTFTQWEPIVDVVIPAGRFNGMSSGPRQLPRCWGFVHFPPTPEGERAAMDAIQALNGTTVKDMKVHCNMSRTSGGGGGGGGGGAGGSSWRKQGGMSGGRSRRNSTGGGDSRPMPHGGQGFGGRGGRSSMESPGMSHGRGGPGGWGGNV